MQFRYSALTLKGPDFLQDHCLHHKEKEAAKAKTELGWKLLPLVEKTEAEEALRKEFHIRLRIVWKSRLTNQEATSQKEERAEVNIDLMKRLKDNIQRHPSSIEDRRMTWCVITWLFSG